MGKGSRKGEENEDKENHKTSMVYLMILLFCITGGLVFGWWLYKYHPTDRHLWMVPFGLVLLITPIIICFSLLVPDLCISNKNDEEQVSPIAQRIRSSINSLCV
ncbi:hypothetical protein L6164_004083 [Bauhinia variegata]|uniref:Uncharacterized protein n=1 Tax=Bauhinia variegata TaxID=167791 RepID=A0ACB9Q5B0_BAUVA|nr:hypothetical protein L6164_004083 [Bauhinia variegata]